jgi:hypothetical protein
MALNFNEGAYLNAFQMGEENRRQPDFNETVTQPLMQGLKMMQESKRQAAMDQWLQEQQGMERAKFAFDYGSPEPAEQPLPLFSKGMRPSMDANKLNLGSRPDMPLVNQFMQMRGGAKERELRIKEQELSRKATDDELDRELKRRQIDALSGTKSRSAENQLRNQYLSQSKDFNESSTAYQRVMDSAKNPTPAGDLSLIFNYMKVLDPSSVVRESEFATAAASGSYGERIKAAVSQVMTGKRLSDDMRLDFVNRATELYRGQDSRHKQRVAEFRGIAEGQQLNPDQIIMDLGVPEGGYNAAPQPTAQKIRVKNIQTGQIGKISPQFFNPEKYQRVP